MGGYAVETELLHEALAEPIGLAATALDIDTAVHRLHAAKRQAGGELARMQIRRAPGRSDEIWLVRGVAKNGEKV
jgi:hypothetical protein